MSPTAACLFFIVNVFAQVTDCPPGFVMNRQRLCDVLLIVRPTRWLAICCLLTLPICVVHGQQESAFPPTPNKATLIQSLNQVLDSLEKRDFQAASQHFVLPNNFRPEMLDGLVQKNEISREGIKLLEQNASFNTASEAFGDERASYFADKSDVDVNQCYGFNHQTSSATAEVIGWWNGKGFKLIRLDDVGKLEPAGDPASDMEALDDSIKASLSVLQAAVVANPTDVSARGKYAMALYQAKQPTAAWAQLLAGNKIKPDHAGINKGLGVMLGVFESQGQLQVGTPAEKIKQTLGVPQQEIELGPRRRWVYGYFGIDFKAGQLHEVIDLRGAAKSLFEPTETVSIDLDGRGWICRMRKKNAGSSSATFHLSDQALADWTERFEVERILKGTKAGSTKEIGEILIRQVSARDPGIVPSVIESNESSITVEFEFPPESEMRYQLVRLLRGAEDVHRIAYTMRNVQPPEGIQNKWQKIFSSASLSPVNRGVERP